jgi:hypothetical protein
MTYLETSQAYLEQSAQLLEAYPETVSPAPSKPAKASDNQVARMKLATNNITTSPNPTLIYSNNLTYPPNLPLPSHKDPANTISLHPTNKPPDPHNNKIQLPHRTPRTSPQTHKITSQIQQARANLLRTRRPHRLPNAENLQPGIRHHGPIPHEQASRSRALDDGTGKAGCGRGCCEPGIVGAGG